jgi:hypothetical protein
MSSAVAGQTIRPPSVHTFRQPSHREVVEAVRIARQERVTVVSISGSPSSPIIRDSQQGFVFVNLDPDAKPMEDLFPDACAELEEWVPDWAALKPLEWVEIPKNCNWKVFVEN